MTRQQKYKIQTIARYIILIAGACNDLPHDMDGRSCL